MRCDRPVTLLLCSLIIAAAWAAAGLRGIDRITLASTCAVTLLCAAIMLHYVRPLRRRAGGTGIGRPAPRDESAEFRRGLFNLCAALKLGVRYCEDHRDCERDALIEQLRQMSDHINRFVNDTAGPGGMRRRARWPWRVNREEHA
jgi:hypothetical protein